MVHKSVNKIKYFRHSFLKSVVTSAIKYVAPEETRSLSQMSLVVVSYDGTDITQTVSWSTSNSLYASVNSAGSVTGRAFGTTTITARKYLSGSNRTVSFMLQTTEIANGTYFLKNKQTGYYADIDGPTMASGTTVHQWKLHGGNSQRWIFNHLGDGYYSIKSNNSSFPYYLGVIDNSTNLNADIILCAGSLTDGMKWKIQKTANGAYKIIPKTGESNGYVLATTTSSAANGYKLIQGEYIDDNSYRDEWSITRLLPTNGYELPYSPDSWSGRVQGNCNCYAYAINNQVKPGTNTLWYKQQMGSYKDEEHTWSELTEANIYVAVENDYSTYNSNFNTSLIFWRIGRYDTCPTGTYKVALVVSNKDYHWYRQDSDGLWSHKIGLSPVERTDYSGNLIIDPYIADRGKYTEFLGYYAVTPWSNMYSASDTTYCYYLGEVITYEELMSKLSRLSSDNKFASVSLDRSEDEISRNIMDSSAIAYEERMSLE